MAKKRAGLHKDIRAFIKKLKKGGVKVVEGRHNPHHQVYCPDGSIFNIPSSSGDNNILRKCKSQLIRRGIAPDLVGFYTTDEFQEMQEEGLATRVEGWEDLPPIGTLVQLIAIHPSAKNQPIVICLGWGLAPNEKPKEDWGIDEEEDCLYMKCLPTGYASVIWAPAFEDYWKVEIVPKGNTTD